MPTHPITTELWLARHGQTDWNLQGRYQGHTDLPLNAAGLAQAAALADAVEGHRLRAIYSSDLQRARTTAQAVGDRWGLPVAVDPRLREVRLGVWEGLVVKEIEARYATAWAERQANPLHARPQGGESIYDLAARVWPAVDEIAARHPGGPVLLVSHGLVLATLLCRTSGTPLGRAFQMIPDNAVVTTVSWSPGAAAELSDFDPILASSTS